MLKLCPTSAAKGMEIGLKQRVPACSQVSSCLTRSCTNKSLMNYLHPQQHMVTPAQCPTGTSVLEVSPAPGIRMHDSHIPQVSKP